MADEHSHKSIVSELRAGLDGRYAIGRQLGEGGMALVFEATDVKHERQVAVKVLRPELSAVLGADRFLREIQVTAKLQHPHILPLYDSGAVGSVLYYVMPLIQGESLRERLQRERELPVPEAVALITTLAGALDYAHRQGVLHRDIKPENILMHDGQPLLADFGIALAVKSAGTNRLTYTGLSIGTPTYMSPEQMSGERALDARSDLYALACVAYESLAGAPPFTGPSVQALVAAVMTSQPRLVSAVRPSVPEPVAAAIQRALAALPADRFASGAEFVAALHDDRPARRPAQSARMARHRIAWLASGILAGGLMSLGLAAKLRSPAHPDIRRLSVVLPDSLSIALPGATSTAGPHPTMALSPAGDLLAYITSQGGTSVLALRSMAEGTSAVLPGTGGAYHPFFSPDGQWIGYFSDDVLRKVAVSGGAPVTLASVNRVTGALWISPERIVVLESEGFDLHWISANGTGADSSLRLGAQFGTPVQLPARGWVAGRFSSAQLGLLSLETGEQLAITRRGVLPIDSVRQEDLLFGSSPQWLPSGYLLYGAGDGLLMAMPFDGAHRQVTGEPVSVLSGMRIEAGFGYAEYAVGKDGTLVYAPGNNQLYVNIAFVGADGRRDTLPFPRGAYTQPRLSPDGTTLAVQLRRAIGGWNVQLMNLATGVIRTVEIPGNYRAYPGAWLPNGRELMIGLWDPVRMITHGVQIRSVETGRSREFPLPPNASYLGVAPDGSRMVFNNWITGDIFLRSLGPDTTTAAVPARGFASSFSKDGRWVAWSGVDGSVAVSPVPANGDIYPVTDRGNMPVWTPDGTGLIFRNAGRYYRVPISTTNGFRAGRATLFAEGPFLSTFAWNHDIAADGRLLVLLNSPEQRLSELNVITSIEDVVDATVRQRER